MTRITTTMMMMIKITGVNNRMMP